MKLPIIKKIAREDVKEAGSWIDGLIGPINSFMDSVYLALNKNIDELNLVSQIKELEVIAPSTYPVMPVIKFASTLKVRGSGLTIMQCYEKGSFIPVATGNPAWSENNGVIEVSQVTGLQAGKTYVIRFRLT